MSNIHQPFDISVCMKTLEHVPPEMVDPYLQALSKSTNSHLFITVPNEIGIMFMAKYLVKSLLGDTQKYNLKEFFYTFLGKTEKVERHDHKGFNYKHLATQVEQHFDLIEVSGHPLTTLPTGMIFGIGIIAKPKKPSMHE